MCHSSTNVDPSKVAVTEIPPDDSWRSSMPYVKKAAQESVNLFDWCIWFLTYKLTGDFWGDKLCGINIVCIK